jgi:RNAse (barnase) inhibitor barstar
MNMNNKVFIFNGNNFDTLDGFYDEVERVLTKDLDWKIGRNLNAFNDILRGGFGAFEYEEPIHIIWEHSGKSKSDLGYPAIKREGQTVFDIIIEIIKDHKHINFTLR